MGFRAMGFRTAMPTGYYATPAAGTHGCDLVTTLFVSPHLDDVVLSCVAHVAEARRRGRVIVATAFGAGQTERRKEDARAMALLGAEQVVLPGRDAPERLAIAPGFASLLLTRYPRETDDREALLTALRPLVQAASVTELVLPLGVGGHVDHRIVHTIHDAWSPELNVRFYEDQPYARLHGALAARMNELGAQPFDETGEPARLPSPTVTAAEARASALTVFAPLVAASADPGNATAELEMLAERITLDASRVPSLDGLGRLISHQVAATPELAEAALRCYASQLPEWFPTPDELRRFVGQSEHERTWRRPRWT